MRNDLVSSGESAFHSGPIAGSCTIDEVGRLAGRGGWGDYSGGVWLGEGDDRCIKEKLVYSANSDR